MTHKVDACGPTKRRKDGITNGLDRAWSKHLEAFILHHVIVILDYVICRLGVILPLLLN